MLSFENVSYSYGASKALDGLTLTAAEGELVTLLGPSGCGKTTTLQLAGGFLLPQTGRITIDGEDVSELPPEKRPTATVFQSHALFPHMNVEENVAYGLRIRRVPQPERMRRAGEILERVGLAGYGPSRVQDISGGQQQRVALARALILNPRVLLLDEPLSSLDARLRVRMREEIRALQQSFGITALYVTHDQEEALAVSDRVAVMDKGKLMQIGTPEEVYFGPKNEFTADFIGDAFPLEIAGKRELVRPDQIAVTADGELHGKLVSRTFLGASADWIIDWKGQKVRASVPSATEPRLETGSPVTFSIHKNKE